MLIYNLFQIKNYLKSLKIIERTFVCKQDSLFYLVHVYGVVNGDIEIWVNVTVRGY
jgi:hypothetical protein